MTRSPRSFESLAFRLLQGQAVALGLAHLLIDRAVFHFGFTQASEVLVAGSDPEPSNLYYSSSDELGTKSALQVPKTRVSLKLVSRNS